MTDDTYLVELCGGRADGLVMEVESPTCDLMVPGLHRTREGMRLAMWFYRRANETRAVSGGAGPEREINGRAC